MGKIEFVLGKRINNNLEIREAKTFLSSVGYEGHEECHIHLGQYSLKGLAVKLKVNKGTL